MGSIPISSTKFSLVRGYIQSESLVSARAPRARGFESIRLYSSGLRHRRHPFHSLSLGDVRLARFEQHDSLRSSGGSMSGLTGRIAAQGEISAMPRRRLTTNRELQRDARSRCSSRGGPKTL